MIHVWTNRPVSDPIVSGNAENRDLKRLNQQGQQWNAA